MLPLLLRVVAVILLLRFAVRLLASWLRPATPSREAPGPAARSARDLVRDRICNTFVPRDSALVATIGGHEEHFCSAACRDQALLLAPRAAS